MRWAGGGSEEVPVSRQAGLGIWFVFKRGIQKTKVTLSGLKLRKQEGLAVGVHNYLHQEEISGV